MGSIALAALVFRCLIQALKSVHEIVQCAHCDLRNSNIVMTQDENGVYDSAVLVDFGNVLSLGEPTINSPGNLVLPADLCIQTLSAGTPWIPTPSTDLESAVYFYWMLVLTS